MVIINGENLTIEDVARIAVKGEAVGLSPGSIERINRSREYVEGIIKKGEIVYGVTTGFGKFCNVIISSEDTRKLQINLIRSHSVGVGEYFPEEIVRAMMLLRINALAKGYSGIRLSTIETLIDMLNKGVTPLVPCQGSLGASGDLVPLAHIALVMMGEGEAVFNSKILPGKIALELAGIKPVVLEAKEGLALINGTQAMSAVGSLALAGAQNLSKVADISGVLSFEALNGIIDAFDEKVQAIRPHPGQNSCARNFMILLEGSRLITRQGQLKVQDAYALRCMPQVHGAIKDAIKHIRKVLEIEINSATDNPLIFSNEEKVISGGNFHGEPVAINMDYLSIAVSELANISERRIERLVNPYLNEGLPPFLIENGGLNSGLMISQYTAAAIVSENKTLSAPASVDSIPSSANQEDHVSMGTIAARKAMKVVENTVNVLAIELLCAAQAMDFRIQKTGLDKALGKGTLAAYEAVREKVPTIVADRPLSDDVRILAGLIKSGELVRRVEKVVGTLE
ncbi:MAG: histidine ammonia-lyase [Thermoanaerobacteraceae bacterium]|jgi:histidine ammonia-lyase|uniref:Histidine ammonia-lyase n=1 Tax=Biomaibacter acetigenes TaxID=2316383 RepID=A0A3G2R4A5_9FIRM|nr:histidine ammonia-lyase [Biomaibacter acetigenes]AYO29757.1 histidine ammonia-lyase [Biomaibacter acetigenes]MDK2878849.1 histidine ammonia-lyase [Thermoanaerobacteraceae bacterium]MDN5311448.1 histidine ammonia-lyase [Thermoanaerobacteraceae bacterium]RKL61811.1 histidine ammonia-lyase [Thermoanaerobacteraceae bacterium SP2]